MANVVNLFPSLEDVGHEHIETILIRNVPEEGFVAAEARQAVIKNKELTEEQREIVYFGLWLSSLSGSVICAAINALLANRRAVAEDIILYLADKSVTDAYLEFKNFLSSDGQLLAILVHEGMCGAIINKQSDVGTVTQCGFSLFNERDTMGFFNHLLRCKYAVIDITSVSDDIDVPSTYSEIHESKIVPYFVYPELSGRAGEVSINKEKFLSAIETRWIKNLEPEDMMKYLNMCCPSYFRLESYIPKLDSFTESQLYNENANLHLAVREELADALLKGYHPKNSTINGNRSVLRNHLSLNISGMIKFNFF